MADAKTKKAPAAKSTSTSSTSKPASVTPTAVPVRVDNKSRRSDDDALEGGWVDVVSGEHKGVRGAFASVTDYDPKTGYPKTILVRNRDHASDTGDVAVEYADARPAANYHGGR